VQNRYGHLIPGAQGSAPAPQGVIPGTPPPRLPTPILPIQEENIRSTIADREADNAIRQQQLEVQREAAIAAREEREERRALRTSRRPLTPTVAEPITNGVTGLVDFERLLGRFQDTFSGPGSAWENRFQSVLGTGTEGQRQWWADMASMDNQLRNALFGASLTEGEKSAWEATTVNPNMTPQEVRRNLADRREIARSALGRVARQRAAMGYDRDAIREMMEQYGELMDGEPQLPQPQQDPAVSAGQAMGTALAGAAQGAPTEPGRFANYDPQSGTYSLPQGQAIDPSRLATQGAQGYVDIGFNAPNQPRELTPEQRSAAEEAMRLFTADRPTEEIRAALARAGLGEGNLPGLLEWRRSGGLARWREQNPGQAYPFNHIFPAPDTSQEGGEQAPGPGLAGRLAASASQGAVSLVGAPVDLLNGGLRMLGLPMSDNPIGGSQSIADALSAIPNALLGTNTDIFSEANAPQSGIEAFGQNALRFLGGGVIPAGALYGRGANLLGGGGPGGGNALAQGIDRMAIETARRPGMTAASEIGAATGGAGGVAAADAIDPNNALLRTTFGMAGGMAGGITSGIAASRSAAPRQLSPEMQAAERQGIPMMPADVGGPAIRRITSAAAQTAPGASQIVRAGRRTQDAAGAARNRVANSVGTPDTPAGAGEAAIRGGRDFQARTGRQANDLYRRAETQAGDTQVDLVNARRVMDEHIAELSQVPGGAPGLALLRDLRSELDGAFPVEGIRKMRTQLRDRFEVGSDAARRAGQVVDAAAEDIVNSLSAAGRPEAARAYRAADRYWRMRLSTIDNVLEPILGRSSQTGRVGTRSGEDVVRTLQQASRARSRQLEAFARAMPEEERGVVRATLINELGRPGAGSPIEGSFALETFLTNWRQITNNRESLGTVRRLFGGDAVRNLEDIATVANASRQAGTYANRSNTGGTLTNAATGTVALASLPWFGAIVTGQFLSGTLLASPRFARWLATTRTVTDPARHIQRLSGIASAEPAIAQDVLNIQNALSRAANDNTMGRAVASPNERQEDN
jgi:hypothetical protein